MGLRRLRLHIRVDGVDGADAEDHIMDSMGK